MKIENALDIKAVNEKFNYFHDGFLRRIELIKHRQLFETDTPEGTKELLMWTVGLTPGTNIELQISHWNYDYPNQPEDRLVLIRGINVSKICESLPQFFAADVFDLRFCKEGDTISSLLTYHSPDAPIRSLDNGIQIVLFVAEAVEIEETLLEQVQTS